MSKRRAKRRHIKPSYSQVQKHLPQSNQNSSSNEFLTSPPTPATWSSTPSSAPAPPRPWRTRWGGATSASSWASTRSRIACRGCARSSRANRAASRRRWAGRAAAGSASTGWARRSSTSRGASTRRIRFPHLAAHVWFAETRTPLDLTGLRNLSGLAHASPLLGIHHDVAYYLLYNGILGDRRPPAATCSPASVLAELPPFDGPKVIYGESCRLSGETLAAAHVTFKQIPYDMKAR